MSAGLFRAHKVTIAWTPNAEPYRDDRTRGQVRVGPLGDDGTFRWSVPYAMTTGACWTNRDRMRGVKSVCQLLLDFNTLVVRDGIDPQAVHREFLKVAEYVAYISRDTDGVAERLRLLKRKPEPNAWWGSGWFGAAGEQA